MGKKLDGAVLVVTGASSGIGRAFAERGSRVVVAARRADALEELARHARQPAARAWPCPPT
jgi:NADP-dependent 3-hydroxy acid dehydrogenase YdfG